MREVSSGGEWRRDLRRAAERAGATVWAGAVSGFLVGGVGGRAAMFVLRLTSDPHLRGRRTDDGFLIGDFTADTFGFLLFAALAGAFAGLLYLGLRAPLPPRWRPWGAALFGATVVGSLITHPDGIDFTLLDPLAVAVALFVAIPALAGFLLSVLAERWRARAEARPGSLLLLLPLLPLAVAGVFGPAVLLVLLVSWALARRFSRAPWDALAGVGRIAFVGIVAWAGLGLARDVALIL